MQFEIPGQESFKIENIMLDLEGTVTIDGILLEGVSIKLKALKTRGYKVFLVSPSVTDKTQELAKFLGVGILEARDNDERLGIVNQLGADETAIIGNGLGDILFFQKARLGVIVMQSEGASAKLLNESDILVGNIQDALDLFLKPARIVNTLRK